MDIKNEEEVQSMDSRRTQRYSPDIIFLTILVLVIQAGIISAIGWAIQNYFGSSIYAYVHGFAVMGISLIICGIIPIVMIRNRLVSNSANDKLKIDFDIIYPIWASGVIMLILSIFALELTLGNTSELRLEMLDSVVSLLTILFPLMVLNSFLWAIAKRE